MPLSHYGSSGAPWPRRPTLFSVPWPALRRALCGMALSGIRPRFASQLHWGSGFGGGRPEGKCHACHVPPKVRVGNTTYPSGC